MLKIASDVFLEGITGKQITDFMLHPTDDRYRRWWPGTHLRFHTLVEHPDHIGDVVMMDEYVGTRRLTLTGVVTEATTGRRITWQLRRWITLPVRLTLELTDRDGGVSLRHIVHAGFDGAGRLLDPIFRLFFSRRFTTALDTHVKTEFPLLRDSLAGNRQRTTEVSQEPPRPAPMT